MFVRRRGCRLQVMRSYRENGAPTNRSIGVVGVFEEKLPPKLVSQLTKREQQWLLGEMSKVAGLCIVESSEVLSRLVKRAGKISAEDLSDEFVYASLLKLKNL